MTVAQPVFVYNVADAVKKVAQLLGKVDLVHNVHVFLSIKAIVKLAAVVRAHSDPDCPYHRLERFKELSELHAL
eukprot:7381284-Prymnesium_polylepis.1